MHFSFEYNSQRALKKLLLSFDLSFIKDEAIFDIQHTAIQNTAAEEKIDSERMLNL